MATKYFAELTVKEFIRYMPEQWMNFPKELRTELLSDANYVVKLKAANGRAYVEIGYTEDEWFCCTDDEG